MQEKLENVVFMNLNIYVFGTISDKKSEYYFRSRDGWLHFNELYSKYKAFYRVYNYIIP